MRKIKLYQNKIIMRFRSIYEMIKIKLRSILRFLSNYLLKILECMGHRGYFFLFVGSLINLSEGGEVNLSKQSQIKNHVTSFSWIIR